MGAAVRSTQNIPRDGMSCRFRVRPKVKPKSSNGQMVQLSKVWTLPKMGTCGAVTMMLGQLIFNNNCPRKQSSLLAEDYGVIRTAGN
jgi:hypothetical protein